MARVYQHYPGPDDYVGRVEDGGRVYGQQFGPDEYLGRVELSGKVYARRPGIPPDELVGRVEGEPLLRSGGAAFFLLLAGRNQEDRSAESGS